MTETLALFGYRGPGHYVQGAGAIDRLGELSAQFGGNPAVLCDPLILELLGQRLTASLNRAGLSHTLLAFPGEVVLSVIDALANQARDDGCDCVIGIGGGKSIDAGKCIAIRINVPFVSVPTAASTDAPASLGAAVYNDDHVRIGSERLSHHPDIVIVDTQVIANAPARLLAAGIGDAISKKFEAEAASASGAVNYHGYRPTHIALAIADLCYRILREHGHQAFRDVEANLASPALDAVIEATVLLSPVGFENGGLSFAHSMQTALMQARGTRHRMHGEHIAYALCVHLAIEQRDDHFILDVMDFLRLLNLPTSLVELDCTDPTDADFAEIACGTFAEKWSRHLPFAIDEAKIIAAMRRIEHLSARTAKVAVRGHGEP